MTQDAADEGDEDELARYSQVLGTLSLDLTRGLLGAMGLSVPDEEALRALVRGAITRGREGGEADPVVVVERMVAEVLGGLRSAFGEPVERHFVAWERDAFFGEPSRFAQLFRWSLVVGRGARAGEAAPPPLVGWIRAELAREEAPEVPRRPESTWDADYFERHGFSANDVGPNPMDAVENTIVHVSFRRAFDRALAGSEDREAELDELHAWGRSEADRRGLRGDRLERPGGWPPLPAAP